MYYSKGDLKGYVHWVAKEVVTEDVFLRPFGVTHIMYETV